MRFDERLVLDGGSVTTTVMVPVGRAIAEARAGERVVASLAFEVGPELLESPRVVVPRVR